MSSWDAVLAEHRGNNGFREGANNANPWGPEQGVSNQPYCASASCMVAYHHGVRFPAGSQFGEKGWAYCPYIEADGEGLGITEYDHASQGAPASMVPGDFVTFDWGGGDGVADHVETVIATYADGTYDTAGYNTGSPEGCHVPIRRDRKYLRAVVHVRDRFYGGAPGPTPPPTAGAPPFPLPPDHWLGQPSNDPRNHSGCYGDPDKSIVLLWQTQMGNRGWKLTADGCFGPQTEQVCRGFQAEKGLTVDGDVGPQTWGAAWTAPVT